MFISFDRVADIYDETRRMPEEVIRQIVDMIARAVEPLGGSMLELGIGTGRIAVPLAETGMRVTGVDVSEKMLAHLCEKTARLANPIHVVRGSILHLPFADNSFDAALAVHVFHLIDDLNLCLRETRRVLRPGGRLLFAGERRQMHHVQEVLFKNPDGSIDEDMPDVFQRYGIKMHRQEEVEKRVTELVRALGAEVVELPPLEWEYEITPAEIIGRIEGRVTSSLWNVPDGTLRQLVEFLKSRLEERIGPPSTPIHFRRSFRLLCARFVP
jgi:ubiquinone/menaquinone biosynthesis C-methylase UbiE